MSPAAETVIGRLEAVRHRWWLFSLLSTCVLAACTSLGVWVVFVFGDALLRVSQGILLALFLTWLAVTAAALWIVGRRLMLNQRGLEATARRVETEYPDLGNDLINLLQMSEDRVNGDQAFCETAIRHAATEAGRVSFDAAAARHTRWERLRYRMQTPRDLIESLIFLGILIAVVVVCRQYIPNWGSASARLFSPWEFVPAVGKVGAIEVSPKDVEILVGGSQEIVAEIKNPQAETYAACIYVQPEGETESAQPLMGDEKHSRYKYTQSSVLKPVKYRVEIGDSQTPIYTIKVLEKPTVADVTVVYRYPAYLNRKEQTVQQKTADLDAPQYTVAELKIRPTTPIAKGHIQLEGQQYVGRVEENGLLLTAAIPLLKNAGFTIHLFNKADHTDPSPRINRIQVVPDKPPTVELLKPPSQGTSAPGSTVPVTIRAGDDYGIGRLRLEMKIQHKDTISGPADAPASDNADVKNGNIEQSADKEPITAVEQWTDLANNTTVVRNYSFELKADKFQPGEIVLVRAVAWDNRAFSNWGKELKSQEAATAWHAIKIIDEDAKTSASLEQIESLRAAVWKILEKQVRARIVTAGISKIERLAERTGKAGDLRLEQVDIQKTSAEVVNSIGQTDQEERQTIKRVLNGLAFGDMLAAVKECDELVNILSKKSPLPPGEGKGEGSLSDINQPIAALITVQDRIIDVLRKLLDVARRAEDELLTEMKKRPGGDLPDDVKQKLEDASKKLEEFLKAQKKVIEASENLAKMPVEDFTKKQEELLKALAAAEDDWAKFMKELHSDLSKLPEQDLANTSMLKEAVEIQVELKMAEDALLKKTADIAVPLEQLGYERAEELLTNIEKWLPDTPDRDKWSQEESLTDKDKEAPMAELPGELEDMIGQLMEEEEDLFDEMEDVSSSAADSLDKGAGWDAMDGPISNMSAKGVTGNRLPNTSEIGGRAGEGRQGKSSGEFVSEEAVGKGGRKTPTRLTPDPYVKGQIKDYSKESVGGATGGGKESGKGGEGLEGPAPRSPGPRELERLAGKQAALRNKAEGIDLKFQVANFHHIDLEKMVEVMSQVEMDLKSGRYQNALRQRQVLVGGLGNVKQYLEGEFELRKDYTSNLPAEVQKEILGGMHDPSPHGWEELNRQYFESLSK
jgi:hypothetical protein